MRKGYFISTITVSIYITFEGNSYYFNCLPSKMVLTQHFDDIDITITDEAFRLKWFLKNRLNGQYYELDEKIIDYVENKYKNSNIKFIDVQ